MSYPYSLLRYSELIGLIERSALLSGISDNSVKENITSFNEIFAKLLSNAFTPLIHRSVQREMISQDNGKLCPVCNSKTIPEQINEIKIIDDLILKASSQFLKKINYLMRKEKIPLILYGNVINVDMNGVVLG